MWHLWVESRWTTMIPKLDHDCGSRMYSRAAARPCTLARFFLCSACSGAVSHVVMVACTLQTSALRGTADSLLDSDATSESYGARWALLSQAQTPLLPQGSSGDSWPLTRIRLPAALLGQGPRSLLSCRLACGSSQLGQPPGGAQVEAQLGGCC